jgi:putative transposon-encoded protein
MRVSMKSKSKRRFNSDGDKGKVKLEFYGEEVFEKTVTRSGNSGRVYLPPNWVGCRVKIVRIN